MIIQNCNLILASSSKIRSKILSEVGLDFDIMKPLFDEDSCKGKYDLKPSDLAVYLAKEKALSISCKFPDNYVIGSDQVCEFENKEVFKSTNKEEAINQLNKFNGKTHYQNNAGVIAFNNKIIFENLTISKLTFRNLSDDDIVKYVDYDKPWGCAGSYKYESMAKHLFSEVDGDYYGILGLSIQPILNFLHKEKLIKIG